VTAYKSHKNLYRLQKRIFKALLVGDRKTAVQVQKILLASTSCILLAANEVILFKKIFEFNHFLGSTTKNNKYGLFKHEIWQSAIRFALEPICEALSDDRNFASTQSSTQVYDVQKVISMHLDHFPLQRRIVTVSLHNCFHNVSYYKDFLVKNIIAPRYIKGDILHYLGMDYTASFSQVHNTLNYIFAENLLNGIESLHYSTVRYADDLIFFFKPLDDEKLLYMKLYEFLLQRGLSTIYLRLKLTSIFCGFNFIGWNFKVSNKTSFICKPSLAHYVNFTKKALYVINNSNYKSSAKLIKLTSLVRDWHSYNKFCNLNRSLNFLCKKAFESFNKDLNQSLYSSKQMTRMIFQSKTDSFFTKRHIILEYFFSRFCVVCGKF